MGYHIPCPTFSFPCPQGKDTEKPGMLCLNHENKITTKPLVPSKLGKATVSHQAFDAHSL